MFGYILPEKPELKVREFELYRAFYCGVCKSIGKRYGQLPRLTLNYDSTFLALLLSSLTDEKLEIKRERCIAHPINKKIIIKNNHLIDYASDMNIALTYFKLKDNWNDESSAISLAGMLLLKSSYKKLRAGYNKKCVIIENRLNELSILEKKKCCSMDEAAEPFARIMEEILACELLCNNEKNEKILRWIGYNIGKWIYILDAYDDIEGDIKKKTYNPLLYQYNYCNNSVNEFKEGIRDMVEFNLTYTLGQISKAHELLETKSNLGIIENIIYMGMLRKTEQILNVGSCKKVEESI